MRLIELRDLLRAREGRLLQAVAVRAVRELRWAMGPARRGTAYAAMSVTAASVFASSGALFLSSDKVRATILLGWVAAALWLSAPYAALWLAEQRTIGGRGTAAVLLSPVAALAALPFVALAGTTPLAGVTGPACVAALTLVAAAMPAAEVRTWLQRAGVVAGTGATASVLTWIPVPPALIGLLAISVGCLLLIFSVADVTPDAVDPALATTEVRAADETPVPVPAALPVPQRTGAVLRGPVTDTARSDQARPYWHHG